MVEIVQGISQSQREMQVLCEDVATFDAQLELARRLRIRAERDVENLFVVIDATEHAIRELEKKGVKRVGVMQEANEIANHG